MKLKVKETKIIEKELTLKEALELPNDANRESVVLKFINKNSIYKLVVHFYSNNKLVRLYGYEIDDLLFLYTDGDFDTFSIIKAVEALTENLEICED